MFRLALMASAMALPVWASAPMCAPMQAPHAQGATVADPPAASPLAPDIAAQPFVRHLLASGSVLQDLGEAHGMRSIAARSGSEFMLFQLAPGGQAAVAGAIALLSPSQLASIVPGGTSELGTTHGLRGLFVRSGAQFQVFYATPDGERVIPGVLWGADGRDLTRPQIASLPGVTPTVVLGDVPSASGSPALAMMVRAHVGYVGNADAPTLWMLADPRCGYSVQAMQSLQPHVAAGRVRVAVAPVAVLDREPGGASARAASAMLAEPPDRMVAAWQGNRLGQAMVSAEVEARLRDNAAIAEAIGLRGTPTFLFRRADGSEGRFDGMPPDVGALVASLGR